MSETTLYNGDCLEVMKDIPDGSVDLILCDLPYGTTARKLGKSIPLDILWAHYRRVLKPYGTVLLFGAEPFASSLRLSNPSMYRYDWVWEKDCMGNQSASRQPLKSCETISVFCHTPPFMGFSKIIKENMERLGLSFTSVSVLIKSRNGNKTGWLSNKMSGKQLPTREQWKLLCSTFGIDDRYDEILAHKNGSFTYNNGQECQKNILRFNNDAGSNPAQKPTALLEFLIKTHSNEGDVVLDNCMGRGSTGVACVNTDRKFIGIEIDEKYYRIAEERIGEAKRKLF